MKATKDIYIGNGEYIPAGTDVADFADKLDKAEIERFEKLGIISDEAVESSKSFGVSIDGVPPMVKQGDTSGKSEDGNGGTVEDLDKLSAKELKELCKEKGIEVANNAKKPEVIALLEAHQAEIDAKGNE